MQIGSPTILADPAVEKKICLTYPHGVYIPVGAMWGAQDIRKMADMGTLKVTHAHVQSSKLFMHSHRLCPLSRVLCKIESFQETFQIKEIMY